MDGAPDGLRIGNSFQEAPNSPLQLSELVSFEHLSRKGTVKGRYGLATLCAGWLGRFERCCLMGCV